MFKSLLNGFFEDVNSWMATNLGGAGITILIVMLSVIALFLLSNIIVAAAKLKDPKLKIKWGQLILLIVIILLIVWLSLTYSAPTY